MYFIRLGGLLNSIIFHGWNEYVATRCKIAMAVSSPTSVYYYNGLAKITGSETGIVSGSRVLLLIYLTNQSDGILVAPKPSSYYTSNAALLADYESMRRELAIADKQQCPIGRGRKEDCRLLRRLSPPDQGTETYGGDCCMVED